MLDPAGDDMVSRTIAAPIDTPECRVVRFSPTRSEDNLLRAGAHQVRYKAPRFFNCGSSILPEGVDGACITKCRPEEGNHRLEDLFVDRCGSVVVQIYAGLQFRYSLIEKL